MKQIESEMLKLINVRHPNLLSVFAVKLLTPHSEYPRLVILSEQGPSLCLQDVLEDCDTLKETRASVCACDNRAVYLLYYCTRNTSVKLWQV